VPGGVRTTKVVPSTDTAENRFVAATLDRCILLVRGVEMHAARDASPGMPGLRREAASVAVQLERWRRHRVLVDLRPIRRLPTTSTVLRGRAGYRDVLSFYGDLLGRARVLPPAAASQIVGMRDAATLYEWWCYFQVIDALSHIVGPVTAIDPEASDWQGARLGHGVSARFEGGVHVVFNRTFSRVLGSTYHSYSVQLRPDILIETPNGRHIFDAKFGFQPKKSPGDDEELHDKETEVGRARRGHIQKMHTYRDALDGVRSVRVIYPGHETEWYPAVNGDDLDGVGAIPLRPGNRSERLAMIDLLKKLIGHSS
jgi:predicted component of viral defense system (DUF524 family)